MTGMGDLGPEDSGGTAGPLGSMTRGARALLDAARDGLSPDAAAVRRVHARVHAAAAATSAAVGTALGVKLALIGVVAAVAIGAGVYLRRAPAAVPASMPSLELASPTEQPERAVAHEATVPAVAGADLVAIETPARDTGRPRLRAAAPAQAAPPQSNPATPAPTTPAAPAASSAIELGREVELVDHAMAALRRGDADAALRVVQEYTVEAAGTGQLVQDIAAIEIEALCQRHDPAARDKRAAFDRRYPRSAQRARLEAVCW